MRKLFYRRAILMSIEAAIVIGTMSSVRAEDITLNGLVQDTSHNNLSDVKVGVEGTKLSTVSDDRGEFALQVTIEENKPLVLNLSKKTYLTLKYIVKDPKKRVEPHITPIVDNNGLVSGTIDLSMNFGLNRDTMKYLVENDRNPKDKKLDDGLYEDVRKEFGDKDPQQIIYRTRLPEKTDKTKGLFLISEHGMGQKMMEDKIFWDFADKNNFALIGFAGNPIQRGIYPSTKLDEIITMIGMKLKHPEFTDAPIITFGHSNGTGFSALYPALRPERTICWISYHSGSTWHLEFPGVELSPGLVMHGTKDQFFKGQDQTVVQLRSKRGALITMMMKLLSEPKQNTDGVSLSALMQALNR